MLALCWWTPKTFLEYLLLVIGDEICSECTNIDRVLHFYAKKNWEESNKSNCNLCWHIPIEP